MTQENVVQQLIDFAESVDRKLSSARIAQLQESHQFFADAGLSGDDIKKAMALTAHEMRLISS